MNNFDEEKINKELENLDEEIQDDLDYVQDAEPDENEEYIEEVESEDDNLSSDYSSYEDYSDDEEYDDNYSNSDFQNQRLKNSLRRIRNQIKEEKVPENLKREHQNQLNNTTSNSPEISENAGSNLKKGGSDLAKSGAEQSAKGAATQGAKTAAGAGTKAAAGAGTAAAGAATEGAATGLTALAASPYFWIVVGVIVLVLIVLILVVLLAAYNGGSFDSSSNSNNGSSNIEYVAGYENCKSITVTGSGTFTLDEYIAGVVHAEHGSAPPEAKKALAVAARTYAIMSTAKCTKAIGNSSRQQNFSSNYDEGDMTAASETSGQVLTYDGKIFLSEYDSWNCIGSSTCNYVREPSNKTHQVSLSSKYLKSAAGGHGRGMSQLAAADMADQGKNYDEILKYFYADGVEISAITEEAATSTDGNGSVNKGNTPNGPFAEFNVRKKKPNWLSSPDNKYYNKQISSSAFQCVWYAKARAVEILSTMKNVDESKKNKAIDTIKSATGHGSYWYKNAQSGGSMDIFESSNDYTKPRPGAMISWKWTDAHWSQSKSICSTENCGHVGIIESVDEENKTVVVSDGWKKCGAWGNSECFGFRNQTWTFEQLKSYGGNYVFLGYVYVADYARGGTSNEK